MPLSRLLRMDVYDARGQGFGKVEDAVIDLADGRAVRLQVRTGGILGRTVAVPFGDFKVVDSDGGVVHTPLSDARLMLQVDANGLPPASVDGLHGCVDVGGRAGTAARPPGSRAALGCDSPDPPLPCPLKIATAVLRTTLAGADGSDLGAVRDIVVDAGSGRIRFIVVAVERFLSDKLVAVGPEGLRPHGAPEGAWRATVSREQLIDAPRLDAGHRPVPAQR